MDLFNDLYMDLIIGSVSCISAQNHIHQIRETCFFTLTYDEPTIHNEGQRKWQTVFL